MMAATCLSRYFINVNDVGSAADMKEEELVLEDSQKFQFIMAHNGWVMNDDPMRDFAKPGTYFIFIGTLFMHTFISTLGGYT